MKTINVVFDFDGVIVDSNHLKSKAFFDIFDHLCPSTTVTQVLNDLPFGNRYDIIKNILLRSFGKIEERIYLELLEAYAKLTTHLVSYCNYIPGAYEFITGLNKGFNKFINSATEDSCLFEILNNRCISHFFNGVFGNSKTKLQNLELIHEISRCDKSSIVFIGDSLSDYYSALEFGCKFIGFSNNNTINWGNVDTFVAKDYKDIKFLFERMVNHF